MRCSGSDAFSTMATGSPGGLPDGDQRLRDALRFADAHVDRAGIGGGEAAAPRCCQARSCRRAAWRRSTLRALPRCVSDVRSSARGGERRGDARHDLARDAGFLERGDLFLRAAEQHRVAALQAHDDAMAPRRVDQALVDELLRGGVPAAALADRDLLARAPRARPCPDARARRGTRCRRRASRRAARSVRRSGAPGPAPTR